MSANHEKTRKPEAPEAVTARGKTFRERAEEKGRFRWEVYVTDTEREDLKQRLRRLRT